MFKYLSRAEKKYLVFLLFLFVVEFFVITMSQIGIFNIPMWAQCLVIIIIPLLFLMIDYGLGALFDICIYNLSKPVLWEMLFIFIISIPIFIFDIMKNGFDFGSLLILLFAPLTIILFVIWIFILVLLNTIFVKD